MKKFLSFVFILSAMVISHSAFSQTQGDTTKPKPKPKKEADKKDVSNPGGGGITIDEGGTPRATKGKKTPAKMNSGSPSADSTQSKPKGGSNQQTSQKPAPAPSPAPPANTNDEMAIDEGGTPKVKPKSGGAVIQPTTGISNDSAMIAPNSTVERPH